MCIKPFSSIILISRGTNETASLKLVSPKKRFFSDNFFCALRWVRPPASRAPSLRRPHQAASSSSAFVQSASKTQIYLDNIETEKEKNRNNKKTSPGSQFEFSLCAIHIFEKQRNV